MSDAADRAGDDGLSEQERDAMVATLLGITPDRLRTMRRVHTKRCCDGDVAEVAPDGRSARWLCIDRLDDDELFDAFRRREVRVRAAEPRRVLSPVDRPGRRRLGRR